MDARSHADPDPDRDPDRDAPDGDAPDRDALNRRFGPLARHMLVATPLSGVWRLSFVANSWTGPAYAALQAETGLGRAEFVVMFCLSQREGLMARDVVRLSGLPKNSISRAVIGLIGRRLVAVVAGEDRRAKPLRLTAAGAALLDAWVPRFAARQEAMLAPLSPSERERLRALLERVADAMPDWIDEVPGAGPDGTGPADAAPARAAPDPA